MVLCWGREGRQEWTYISVKEGDKQLIAAAPDLLAACELVDEFECKYDRDGSLLIHVPAERLADFETLRAAIAKAKGPTP